MKMNITKVGICYLLIVLLGVAAVARIIDLQFIHKPDVTKATRTTRNDVIPCTRGSILAGDGRYLAFSIPEYRLYMDCIIPSDTLFNNNIDALADSLANFYGDRKAKEYKDLIVSQRKAGRQYTAINKQLLTYQEMKRAEQFPIFRAGRRRGGLIVEKFDRRNYPYDRLAYRVLGHIQANEGKGIGIEGSCDSILRGTPGVQPMRLTEHHNWIANNDSLRIEPIDGSDIQTTIDIDIQDISERALLSQLYKSDLLEAGTTIVMETATGEIKAMVNMKKTGDGKYSEDYNYAIGQLGEPGSVFKLATLTILLDEGKVNLDTEIKAVVNWQHGKGKPFEDHYLRNYDMISVQRGFEISSNNVFRMLAAKYYDNDPAHFIDKLNNQLKISYNFPFELAGFGKAKIKHPNDGTYWSDADLPQIAMGYTLQLTPLHTLSFYNAIANGGVMMKPRLVKNYQKNGVIIKEFPPEEVATVCKPSTVKELHKAMRAVVANGTGRNIFKDCKVDVAGKTGTSRIYMPGIGYTDRNGRKKHQASFAGFFPADNPKYTVITVVYSYPTTQNFYGATWAGPVVREIAEELYANSPDWNEPLREKGKMPEIVTYANVMVNDTIQGTPDVTGMGLRDAVKVLESKGYKVSFEGHGKIREQSPQPGQKSENNEIRLVLAETIKK